MSNITWGWTSPTWARGNFEVKIDFKITEVDFSGVARGDPPKTPIKSIEVTATASLDFDITEMILFNMRMTLL